jgi:uncharacterized membrane protein
VPTGVYGLVLLSAAVAYFVLERIIIADQGPGSVLKRAVGRDWKGKASPILYAAAITLSFAATWLAQALYVAVAMMWLVPDRRIERTITS